METFKCYVCGTEVGGGYHVFMEARSAREKDRFRDVCEGCVTTISVEVEGGHGVLAEPKAPAEDARALLKAALGTLPDGVRHGVWEPFWDKCEKVVQ